MTADPSLLHTPLTLCATARQVQALREQHARQRALAGQRVAPTLAIHTLDQWLEDQHESLLLRGLCPPDLQRLVLESAPERALWEAVIRDRLREDAIELFDVSALARHAQQAHALCVAYGVEPKRLQTDGSAESRHFAGWQREFLARCDQHGWMDATRWRKALVAALAQAWVQHGAPPYVTLYGFLTLDPLEQGFVAALKNAGCSVEVVATASTHADLPKLSHDLSGLRCQSLSDPQAELYAAAQWAAARLTADPQCRLAIVVPDLAQQRAALQDALDAVLAPHTWRPAACDSLRPYNFSLGLPLRDDPRIRVALQVLAVVDQPHMLVQSDLSALLLSPWWSLSVREADARAQLEARLRRKLRASTKLVAVQAWVQRERAQTPLLKGLAKHLQAILDAHTQTRGRAAPSLWAQRLPALLESVGWPGERTLSSHDYQWLQAFFEEVTKLARLDAITGEIDFNATLRLLRQALAERVFQPKTEGQPRLQVLGLLEASGLQFDGLWVLGLTDSVWPPAPRPNPLLPAHLQRQLGMPHASAAVQTDYAQRLQASLLVAAPDVVLSWHQADGASPCDPSPLLPTLTNPITAGGESSAAATGSRSLAAELPSTARQRAVGEEPPAEENQPATLAPQWIRTLLAQPGQCLADPMLDAEAPAVRADEEVRGGASLLNHQSLCPAWAYFAHRLHAQALEEPIDGLDPRERGDLVHRVLESIFRQYPKQEDLARAIAESSPPRLSSTGDPASALAEAFALPFIEQALNDYSQKGQGVDLGPRAMQLEKRRLQRLIGRWLPRELERPTPFEVVVAENKYTLALGALRLRVIIDRIDRLPDGALLISDYKTGSSVPKWSEWTRDRLREVQLPLYATLAPDELQAPVVGAIFAQLHVRQQGWSGLAATADLLPKVANLEKPPRNWDSNRFPDWSAVLQHWSIGLELLATEVQRGNAAVCVESDKDLQWCDVKPLLRLAERQQQWLVYGRSADAPKPHTTTTTEPQQ